MNDLKHFAPVLDDKDILHQRDDMAPHLMDWRGQFESHYAPRANVRLNAKDKRQDEVYIGFGPSRTGLIPDFNLSEQADLIEAAANLFAVLHEADAQGTAAIAFGPIPMAGLGLAINDRISRAAAPRPSSYLGA